MATVTSEHKAGMTEAVHAESEYDYPHGLRLTAIVGSLLLGMFLVSLDNVRLEFLEQLQRLINAALDNHQYCYS